MFVNIICFSPDFVLDRPTNGFPSSADIDCIKPEGYETQWVDQIWKRGRWKNLERMAEPFGSTGEVPKPRCIDPFKCYQSRPNLPYDYTVEIIDTGVNANENEVNTTFVYKCATESK